ncbi:hypothetical protein A2U01_0073264, partial [Trifolium medium]|nr:hypothetical protein [Trifolium medium]
MNWSSGKDLGPLKHVVR